MISQWTEPEAASLWVYIDFEPFQEGTEKSQSLQKYFSNITATYTGIQTDNLVLTGVELEK